MDVLRSVKSVKRAQWASRNESRAIAGGLGFALALLVAAAAWGAPSESDVKAAYLYNFARYVTWPASAFDSPDEPIRICVVGDDAFRGLLEDVVSDKRVGDRPVSAEARASAGDARGCHILFVGAARAGAVAGLSGQSVFTVSDSEGFASGGGIANFVLVGNKVRFEINTNAVEKAGLQVSSRLLRVAQIVE